MAEAEQLHNPTLNGTADAIPNLREVPAPARHVKPMSAIESYGRMLLGLTWMGLCVVFFCTLMLFFLPFRQVRIRISNLFGSVAGGGCAYLSGSKLNYDAENVKAARAERPAIYVSNHTSILDIMLGIWFSPYGTVGVGKKEVIFYPFFGQLFALAGHLRIDRSNREKAIAGMKSLEPFVKKNNLSTFMWPEGHRSRDGRLRPFKKGVAHLAIACKLPIVPMVVRGAQHAWESRQLRLAKTEIDIEFLPAVDTSEWKTETIDQHLKDLEQVFIDALPPEQRPLPEA